MHVYGGAPDIPTKLRIDSVDSGRRKVMLTIISWILCRVLVYLRCQYYQSLSPAYSMIYTDALEARTLCWAFYIIYYGPPAANLPTLRRWGLAVTDRPCRVFYCRPSRNSPQNNHDRYKVLRREQASMILSQADICSCIDNINPLLRKAERPIFIL